MKEMWQVRQKELELDRRLKRTIGEKGRGSSERSHRDDNESGSSRRHPNVATSTGASSLCYSNTREHENYPEGLRDEELEEFLHSKYCCFLLFSNVVSVVIVPLIFVIETEELHILAG